MSKEITNPLYLTITAKVDRDDYRKFLDGMLAADVRDCFGARLTEVYADNGEVLTTIDVDTVLISDHRDRHDEWDIDESLEYDPMNVVGRAGFTYKWDVDECEMVFSRGEGDEERHMLGHPFRGGINLMLGGSFYNYTLIEDHATAEGFLAAFTAKWEELVSDHYDED